LRKVPPRLQELGELELAARELRRAINRAQLRNESAGAERLDSTQFELILEGTDFIVELLSELLKAHPGDSVEVLEQLIEERKSIPGWENWSRIVRERLNDSLLERRAVG